MVMEIDALISQYDIINVMVSIPLCLKTRYKDYISQTHLTFIVVKFTWAKCFDFI